MPARQQTPPPQQQPGSPNNNTAALPASSTTRPLRPWQNMPPLLALRRTRSLPLIGRRLLHTTDLAPTTTTTTTTNHTHPAVASTDDLLASARYLDHLAHSAHPKSPSDARSSGSGHDDDAGKSDDSGPDWTTHSPYSIPKDAFKRLSKDYRHGSTTGYWTYDLFRNADDKPPVYHYCRSLRKSEEYAALFQQERVLGFDLEWKGNASSSDLKAYVSTIQIASDSRVAVFHIALHAGDRPEDLVGPKLRALLEDPAILKVGVNIAGDVSRLSKRFGVNVANTFDTSRLYRTVNFTTSDPSQVNRKPVAMATQVLNTFGLPISKDTNVRSSDWTHELTKEQVVYAASDAYAGWWLYTLLEARRLAMDPVPALPSPTASKPPSGGDRKKRRKAPLVPLPPSPELDAANAWLATHAPRFPRVPQRHLRAYALWHVVGLGVNAAAKKLRQPRMLSTATVADYIVQAVAGAAAAPVWLELDTARVPELAKALGSRAERVEWAVERVARRRRDAAAGGVEMAGEALDESSVGLAGALDGEDSVEQMRGAEVVDDDDDQVEDGEEGEEDDDSSDETYEENEEDDDDDDDCEEESESDQDESADDDDDDDSTDDRDGRVARRWHRF